MSHPTLYLMVGYPGAGKTTVAKWISEATGAIHLWADLERHKMFEAPTHSTAESRQLYDQLNRQADTLLAEGKSVVFDTSFNHYQDRELLRQIATRRGAETKIIWIATPLETARTRAVHADIVRNGYDFTMSAEQFDAIADKLEPPRENEAAIKIDGTKLDSETVIRLIGQ